MAYLWRSQAFARGVVLLTGTGVVPDDSFTLAPKDHITIIISGIGRLENAVTIV
jgi:2-dehydro-3-deoxy-D-arabinonate dehydratase